MSYRTCDHLKEDGVLCGSPALHNHNFCYFHLNARADDRRHPTSRPSVSASDPSDDIEAAPNVA
jgi:hypothetical protein